MKSVLLLIGTVLFALPAFAGKYSVSCYDSTGRRAQTFKQNDIKDVNGMSDNAPIYEIEYYDGRKLYVPKSNCIVEELKDRQTPLI